MTRPPEFESRLHEASQRVRLVRRRTRLSHAALWISLIGLLTYAISRWQSVLIFPAFGINLLAGTVILFRSLARNRTHSSDELIAARWIESEFPELDARLITACEQRPDDVTGEWHLLQAKLIDAVNQHARTHDWTQIIPGSMLRGSFWQQFAALAALMIVSLGWVSWTVSAAGTNSTSTASILPALSTPRSDFTIDPGDVALERGQPLLALIRFQDEPPRDVTLSWQPSEGSVQQIAMTKSLDDPIFAGRIAEIASDGAYRLEFADVVTPEFKVAVYDLPALVHSTLRLTSPGYTNRPDQLLENATSATVIEGSQVNLICRVNKPLARVELVDPGDNQRLLLNVSPNDPLAYSVIWSPDRSRRWQLRLTDDHQRMNRDLAEITIDVIPNRPPEIKPVFPEQDQRVSPLQELTLEARISDDFGLTKTGLMLDLGGDEPVTLPLSDLLAGGEAHAVTHWLALENYQLTPGNVVSYSFFAEDIGPDGQPRQTVGDLFFLEIRPFEESYRQMEGAGGQSGAQGASGSPGQNLEKLIDLQKQIVSATWNLQRTRPDFEQSEPIATLESIRESQQHAQDQFEEVAEAIGEAVPAEKIRGVFEAMSQAIEKFMTVEESKHASELAGGLQGARSAFQGLVRLRPTDHRLMQGGQSGGGAGGGGSMSQQQLNQLELDSESNRYETEKAARQTTENSVPREQLAILNRLKELAQRQQGLNQRLKELDAELRAAQTDAERDELDRQLKQLRDEQQELLQDADALRNRLEQSSRPDQMADARKQLEETRPQLVDAAESLKEGKLSQALSSGTRAERDLNKLQDDFRKQSSAQLAEAMQQLRSRAKELVDEEQNAAKKLTDMQDAQPQSLRRRQEWEDLAAQFEVQTARLEATLQQIRETVQAAETSEPLAAKTLYEAARDAQQQKADQALTATSQLLRRGFLPEAAQAEVIAQKSLNQLRQRVESAAESILGDELADLKRAKRELNDLAQELQQELEAARGEPAENAGQPVAAVEDQSANEKATASSDPSGAGSSKSPSDQPGDKTSTGDFSTTGSTPSESGTGTAEGDGSESGGLRGGLKRRKPGGQQPPSGSAKSGQSEGGQGGGPGGQGGPLTGGNYGDWSDRLRDVETLLNDPDLQANVAKVREQARSMRADFKRHSRPPNWDVVKDEVQQPLVELQRRLAEEIARRESPDALVPIDRDPVPERYRELVRQYYERLGSGQK